MRNISRRSYNVRRAFVQGVLPLLLCAAGNGANATSIQVTASPNFASDNLSARGTYSLLANTQQNRSANPPIDPSGPNATQTYATVLGGVAGTGVIKVGPSIIEVLTGVIGDNQAQAFYGDKAKKSVRSAAFGPTITTGLQQKQLLTRAGDNATITSNSGRYTAEASAFISAGGVRGISVSTSVTGPQMQFATGQAAAQANDPYAVPGGQSYAYQPTVDATLNLDTPGFSVGFAQFAVDSSTFTTDSLDNFASDGSPIDQTLWYFSLGAVNTNGNPSLIIDFQINPVALNEIKFDSSFLASLGPFSDTTSEILLIDQAIDRLIGSQVSSAGSVFTLNGAHVFPNNTVFLPSGSGVQYANGLDALTVPIPEPNTLPLVIAGLLCLIGLRRRLT